MLVKLKAWALALLAALATIGSAWLWGWRQGRAAQRQADDVRDAQANAQAVQQRAEAQEARHEVETEISQLPAAPAQRLGDADPATAAGRLRTGGWLRDKDSGSH